MNKSLPDQISRLVFHLLGQGGIFLLLLILPHFLLLLLTAGEPPILTGGSPLLRLGLGQDWGQGQVVVFRSPPGLLREMVQLVGDELVGDRVPPTFHLVLVQLGNGFPESSYLPKKKPWNMEHGTAFALGLRIRKRIRSGSCELHWQIVQHSSSKVCLDSTKLVWYLVFIHRHLSSTESIRILPIRNMGRKVRNQQVKKKFE